jgi:hypothetical protein
MKQVQEADGCHLQKEKEAHDLLLNEVMEFRGKARINRG